MCLKYNEKAKEAGVYIIGSCGWDSIPCDMGVQYAIQQFDGTLDSVETVAEFHTPKVINFTLVIYSKHTYMIITRYGLPPVSVK